MLKSLGIQIIIFIVIFNVLSWFRSGDMLSSNTKITSETQLPTLMNSTVALQSKHSKTVVYFFAPWCQVCHFSIENLENFYLKNQNVNVVAVALDYTDIDEVRSFVRQHQLTFPIALGNEETKQKFNISGYPSYYVIDEDNTVLKKSMGYSSQVGIYLRTL